ncbi:MAG TPA: GntR family transcriptional regulator [Ktedonobacteraceae bacterium]|jgi:DNA-binding GntR family transcriptional regulator|nr:GntR family transcriptional regulator [Ktedonobacteraceae bacterium]
MMSDSPGKIRSLPPIVKGEDLNGVVALYHRLRKLILDGTYAPGTMLSQVELAEVLGVSRTPLREALRMLQKEGLIEAEHNQRARIPSFNPQVLDSIYASRVLLEALGIRLTVPRLHAYDLEMLQNTLTELLAAGDAERREEPHRRFHRLLIAYAGEYLYDTIAGYADRCTFYRRMYVQSDPRNRVIADAEHEAILQACIARDAETAAYRLTQHLARTALTLLAQLTPEYEPVAVRTALQISQGGLNITEPKKPGRRAGSASL